MRFVPKLYISPHVYSALSATFLICRPFQFRMEEIDAFRYRAQDAWKAVTRIAVREARLAEIKAEMMKCKKLKVKNCIFSDFYC